MAVELENRKKVHCLAAHKFGGRLICFLDPLDKGNLFSSVS